eukprot:5070685-Ditylum_brightwellii.AAC.1
MAYLIFYIDDLKVYARNDEGLERCQKLIKRFSDDIGMKFGLDKCALLTIVEGHQEGVPEPCPLHPKGGPHQQCHNDGSMRMHSSCDALQIWHSTMDTERITAAR